MLINTTQAGLEVVAVRHLLCFHPGCRYLSVGRILESKMQTRVRLIILANTSPNPALPKSGGEEDTNNRISLALHDECIFILFDFKFGPWGCDLGLGDRHERRGGFPTVRKSVTIMMEISGPHELSVRLNTTYIHATYQYIGLFQWRACVFYLLIYLHREMPFLNNICRCPQRV